MIAALFAASSVFVGCTTDEPPVEPPVVITRPPSVMVYLNDVERDVLSVVAGTSVKVKIVYQAEAGFTRIDLKEGDVNYTGFPKENLTTKTETLEFTAKVLLRAGKVKYTTEITDKENRKEKVEIEITFTETNLGDKVEFTIIYRGGLTGGGPDATNTEHGIWYHNNPTVTTGKIEIVTNGNDFVMLTENAYTAIKTKEALQDAYNATNADKQKSFTATSGTLSNPSGGSFTAKYFISKVAENYFLIKLTGLKFDNGINTAYFESRK